MKPVCMTVAGETGFVYDLDRVRVPWVGRGKGRKPIDRFHVVKALNQAVDEVCKEERVVVKSSV